MKSRKHKHLTKNQDNFNKSSPEEHQLNEHNIDTNTGIYGKVKRISTISVLRISARTFTTNVT